LYAARIEPDRVVIRDTRGERSILRDAFAQGFLAWPQYCKEAIPEDTLRDAAMTLSFIFGIFRML
jgi:hypothetical protein